MYKKRWLSFLLLCLLLTMPACAVGPGQPAADQAGGAVWTAALEDNPSAAAWRELLSKGPLVVDMHDYGGFEKVGSIGADLPQSNRQVNAKPGDVILYQGSRVTIYYGENSWNVTPLGHIGGVTEAGLREALKAGGSHVSVTFSLEDPLRDHAGGAFDLERGSVRLNSGCTMPINSLGTYSLTGETCASAVKAALAHGVRLFDTASIYTATKPGWARPSGSPAFPVRRFLSLPSSIRAASMTTRRKPFKTRWTSWAPATST